MVTALDTCRPVYAPVERYRLTSAGPDPVVHIFLFAEGLSPPRPRPGLTAVSQHRACYMSPGESRPAPLELIAGPAKSGQCGFWEVSPQLMPGVYALQVPSYARTPGHTFIYLHFAGAMPHYLELHGIGHDPYDSFALGLTTWIRSTCHEHLTSGLRKSLPATLRPLLEERFAETLGGT
jgi:hypothetical protein